MAINKPKCISSGMLCSLMKLFSGMKLTIVYSIESVTIKSFSL